MEDCRLKDKNPEDVKIQFNGFGEPGGSNKGAKNSGRSKKSGALKCKGTKLRGPKKIRVGKKRQNSKSGHAHTNLKRKVFL